MSSTYNGNGTIPQATVPYGFMGLLSSTFATPIVITTATPHGFTTGDTVVVEGHQVNTNANGRWVITVTGGSTFSLNGSVGNGVGAGTGMVNDYAVNPLATIPGDADLANASSVNTPIEAALNAVPFLYERVGSLRLLQQYYAVNPTTTLFNATSSVTPASINTWTDWTGLANIFGSGAFGPGRPVAKTGDTLEFHFTGTLLTVNPTNTNGFPAFGVRAAVNFSGGEQGNVSSAQLFNAPAAVGTTSGQSNYWMLNLYTLWPVLAAQNLNAYDMTLQWYITNTGNSISFAMGGPWTATLRHWRAN